MTRGKKISASERVSKIESSASFRRELFREFLKHVESGKSHDCFPALSWSSVEACFLKFPDEWIVEEYNDSVRKAKAEWEDIGRKQSTGHCIGNSRSWYYNMSNRYGWSERSKVENDVKGSVTVSIVNYSNND